MNNPEYAKIGDKKYKINTDFRIALKCQEIAIDNEINDYERALAILYLLYGDDGLNDKQNQEKLLEIAVKYLKCGQDDIEDSNDKPDMDLLQDIRYIEASFKSDYGITLSKEKMHWWDFYTYLNGLTEECVLNRIRAIRSFDLSTLTDTKEKNRIRQMQKRFALKEKERPITDKQKLSVDNFYKLTGISRKE